ncbi:MAG: MATE family efflux transporter, partial [Aquabacterium sp.]
GLGASFTLCASAAALALWWPVARGAAGFMPQWRRRPQRALFVRSLAVGAVASTLALIGNLSLMLVTAQLGRFGPAAVAAFGIAARLEFLVVPVAFGVGSAATAMVGRAVGAGDWARARQVAWMSGAIAFVIAGSLGLVVALAPRAAAGLFTSDAAVADIAAQALRWTGYSFGLFGLGMALYFASLGAGRLKVPALAAVTRLALAAGLGGWLAQTHGPDGLFIGVALGAAAYGLINAAGVRPGLWKAR